MHNNISNLQCRLYLEAAKFHYKQMALNIQDKNVFLFYLLAFLPLARSVTLVFQEEFSENKRLMKWYQTKKEAWKNNKVMRYFIDMRNISLHKHAPIMLLKELVPLSVLLHSSVDHGTKQVQASNVEVVSYVFELSQEIDENPEVMSLCLKYLDELEEFVIETEDIVRKEVLRQHD
jgi:hypothetical protein